MAIHSDVLADVKPAEANIVRTRFRRAVLVIIGLYLLIAAVGLFDVSRVVALSEPVSSENSGTDMPAQPSVEVTLPRLVRAGTSADMKFAIAAGGAPPQVVDLCVSSDLLDFLDRVTVDPVPSSTHNCEDGTQWTFAGSDVWDAGEITISGTVSDASAFRASGMVQMMFDSAPASAAVVDLRRLP